MSMTRVLGAVLAAGLCSLAGAARAPAAVEVRPDLRQGDVVRVGAVGVTVPEPGGWATARQFGPTGEETVTATTDTDGLVTISSPLLEEGEQGLGPVDGVMPQTLPDPPLKIAAPGLPPLSGAAGRLATGDPDPCTDDKYNLDWITDGGVKKNFKWKTTFGWRFRTGTTPPEVT